jgi:gluconolactonase
MVLILLGCYTLSVAAAPLPVPKEGIFAFGARLKREAGGRMAGEGPAWHPQLGVLASGDFGISQTDRTGKTSIYRHREGEASCGMLFDRQGRLVICDALTRRLMRLETDGRAVVLTDNYQGKRYNSPNDLTIDGKDRIYFSDPRYGERVGMEILDEQGEPIEGVYRVDPDGKVKRVISREVERPNGVLVSADDRYLYVIDNNDSSATGARKLWRFNLQADGSVGPAERKLLYDWGQARGGDGIKQDQKGRLYVAAGLTVPKPPVEPDRHHKSGIYVFDPEGTLLDFLPVPNDLVTNLAFGGDDLKTLYITAGGSLYSIRTTTPGRVVWPKMD